MALQECCRDIIRRLEDPKTPFFNSVISFLGAVTLRNYLEQFSDKTTTPTWTIELHYALFFTCLALSLIVLFYFATRESVAKIARVVLSGFIVLPFVPPIDLVLSLGKGYPMSYLQPGVHQHLLRGFLLLGGPYVGQGITPGQRMEVAVVITAACVYFYIKTGKILRSFLFAFFTYALLYLYVALLFVLAAIFGVFGAVPVMTQESMIGFYLFLILPLSQAVFFFYNREYFIAIWKDARMLRIIHFLLMVALGYVFMLNQAIILPAFNPSWLFIVPAIVFSGFFSIIVNNREDREIDKISNSDRPTISNSIPAGQYQRMAWFFLGLALVFAAAAGFLSFFTIFVVIAVYFLYSAPPFRLKRIPFFSKLPIAFNSLLLFALGDGLPGGKVELSLRVVVFFLTGLTAVINFIDIKDFEGDKAAGIKTLPTLLGVEKAKRVIGAFFVVVYLGVFWVVRDMRLLPALLLWGGWMYSLVNRSDYDEKLVFKSYVLSLMLLIAYFLWIKSTGQFLDSF